MILSAFGVTSRKAAAFSVPYHSQEIGLSKNVPGEMVDKSIKTPSKSLYSIF
jgi:hypothetical protein